MWQIALLKPWTDYTIHWPEARGSLVLGSLQEYKAGPGLTECAEIENESKLNSCFASNLSFQRTVYHLPKTVFLPACHVINDSELHFLFQDQNRTEPSFCCVIEPSEGMNDSG